MIRSRIVSILAVLPLVCGLVFVAYYFGPGPTAVAVPVAKNDPNDAKPTTPPAAKPDQNSQVFKLFGIHDKEIARGRADSTPGDYLNSLETVYKQRGYQKLVVDNPATKGKLKRRARVARKAGAQKFFIRQESDGAGSIWATGVDADHTTAQEATEPFSFTTLVTKSESGGAEWVAYRMQVDQGKLQQLVFKNGTREQLGVMYARSAFEQHCDIPAAMGCEMTEEGFIKTDSQQRTSIPGIFACGDNTSRMRTVANAVSTGAISGMMVNREMIFERFSKNS